MPSRTIVVAVILVCGVARAQKPLEFEVASVKLSDTGPKNGPMYFKNLAGDLTATNVTLRSIIAFAYQLQDSRLLGGPRWIESERYTIDARVERTGSADGAPGPNEMSEAQRQARDERTHERVRTLLADRFGLVVHRETRELPVFELSVAGPGPKLKEVDKIGPREGTGGGRGRSEGYSAPITSLATALADVMGRPVLDKTGLTGRYDWVMEWTPEPTGPDAALPDGVEPGLFAALREQLGLRVRSARGPVGVVVIDKVEHVSGN